MKVIIIGDGLAGRIAHHAMKSMLGKDDVIEVYDARREDSVTENHHAVLRIRDPQTALYLGADIEEIEVTKGIFWNGDVLNEASVLHNNLYSKKLGNSLQNKSIRSLGACKRYLLHNISKLDSVQRGKKFVGFADVGEAIFEDTDTGNMINVKYDAIISTIPMPMMLSMSGIAFKDKFTCHPIYVTTGKLMVKSDVHQTLYFPDPSMGAYRATIQGDKFIIESIGTNPKEYPFVFNGFGLYNEDYSVDKTVEQKNGKMILIDESNRKKHITKLTDEYNIFSFGRFAIWKPIRTDHLIPDIDRIKSMMKSRYNVNKIR
jgi:hypothetical protein